MGTSLGLPHALCLCLAKWYLLAKELQPGVRGHIVCSFPVTPLLISVVPAHLGYHVDILSPHWPESPPPRQSPWISRSLSLPGQFGAQTLVVPCPLAHMLATPCTGTHARLKWHARPSSLSKINVRLSKTVVSDYVRSQLRSCPSCALSLCHSHYLGYSVPVLSHPH